MKPKLERIEDENGHLIGQRRHYNDGSTGIRLLDRYGSYTPWGPEAVVQNQNDDKEGIPELERGPESTMPKPHKMGLPEFEPSLGAKDKNLHLPGAKDDENKLRAGLVLGGFNGALTEVCRVGTYGANKYTDDGWRAVPDGKKRYMDAAMRHLLDYMSGKEFNFEDGNVRHLAQVCWNLLAVLEFDLAEDQMNQVDSKYEE